LYHPSYNYIQSSHFHLERIKGTPTKEINFNIENLVALLDVIIKIQKKDLEGYPFIGSWEKELQLVTGHNFELAQKFKNDILLELKNKWLSPENFISSSSYYKKLKETGYTYPLKIFSLNYDMCVEANIPNEETFLERGFDENKIWDYKRYDQGEDIQSDYLLYKLHGSLDWKRDEQTRLTYVDLIQSIEPLHMEIIFGIQNKLQSYDPYLFYFYAFREACFDAELIIISGYGFMDKHINDNLENAFRLDKNKRILINLFDNNLDEENFKSSLSKKLKISSDRITLKNCKAKEFFNDSLNIDFFSNLFSTDILDESILPI
jgi:SIR2-like domain